MVLLFLAHLLNGLLMVAMPVGLGIYLTRRFHIGWRLWWIGAATFVISQVGHIPFNSWLTSLFQSGALPQPPVAWIPYFNPVVLGLSAGLFEELSRTAVYAWWAKDARSWRKGVMLGAGHGGAEAIILGILVLYAFLQMSALRTANLSALFPANQAPAVQAQVTAYWTASIPSSLLGALERFFTIPTQICFSIIVLQAFTRRQPAWVVVAIVWHAIIDGISVYLTTYWAGQPWANYALEGVIAGLATISVAILFLLRQPEPHQEPEEVAPTIETIPLEAIKPVKIDDDVNPDKLDDSRYSG